MIAFCILYVCNALRESHVMLQKLDSVLFFVWKHFHILN